MVWDSWDGMRLNRMVRGWHGTGSGSDPMERWTDGRTNGCMDGVDGRKHEE